MLYSGLYMNQAIRRGQLDDSSSVKPNMLQELLQSVSVCKVSCPKHIPQYRAEPGKKG